MKKHLHNLVRDLVESRLWLVAVLLIAALGAVPVLLGGGDEPAAPAGATPTAPATSDDAATAQKAEVTLDEGVPADRDRGGEVRNPFRAPKGSTTAAQTAGAPTPPAPTGSTGTTPPAGASSDAGSTGSGSTGSGATGPTGGTTPQPQPQPQPQPKPKTGTPAQPKAEDAQDTYHVDLKFGVNGAEPKAIKDVARLSPLPSLTDPFFVFLGVIETKAHQKRAVFLVSSDATPNGEGSCHPTTTDCESVELAVGQTAFFDYDAPDGTATQYQLELTKIRKTEVSSEAKARAAVARHSVAGGELLRDAATRNVRFAAGARAYRFVPALGTLVRAKRRHVSARAAAAGTLVPGLALLSRKHQPGIPVWHSPKK
jgi:hypothetical protein